MNERDDKDLQRYLSGDSEVSRAYAELERPSPPPELDAKILAAARAEARRVQRPAWMVPVALAATVVLGIGLSMEQLRRPGSSISESDMLPASPDAIVPAEQMDGVLQDAPAPRAARRPPAPRIEYEETKDVEAEKVRTEVDTGEMARRAMAEEIARQRDVVASSPPLPEPAFVPPPAPVLADGDDAPRRSKSAPQKAAAKSVPPQPLAAAADTSLASSAASTADKSEDGDTAVTGRSLTVAPPAREVKDAESRQRSASAFAVPPPEEEPAPRQDNNALAASYSQQEGQATSDTMTVDEQARSRADERAQNIPPASMSLSVDSRAAADADEIREADSGLDQVTVSGSRIRRAELETGEPVTTVSSVDAEVPGYRQRPADAELMRRLDALGDEPDNVLAGIASLYEIGERDAARRMLELFLERHPEHVLPDDYPLTDPRLETPASPTPR